MWFSKDEEKESLFDELSTYKILDRWCIFPFWLQRNSYAPCMTLIGVYERSCIWRKSIGESQFITKKCSELESAASLGQGFCDSQAPTPIGFPQLSSSWSSIEGDADAAVV